MSFCCLYSRADLISCNYYSYLRSAAREMQEVWGPLGCLGLLLFITAMNKRIMISEILPSSSGCKFNPFKNCCNPFASDGFWVSLITFFGSLLHWRGWETGGNGRKDFCRPYQNALCLFFGLGHCVSLGTLEKDCVSSSHVTAAVVVISIHHLTRYSTEECGEQRAVTPHYYGYLGLYKCLGRSEGVC